MYLSFKKVKKHDLTPIDDHAVCVATSSMV